MMVLNRGDICLVNFNPSKGGEMGKLRPAIIMSDAEENSVLNTCIVVPLSTVIEKDALPYRYTITKRDKLQYDSDACINEIRALSKIRIKEKLSSLSKKEMEIIQKALCKILL
ncbi:MAG: type II toxin-antitoxin system PemK/MazF family toxin [Epsilonproteobacteria bacterium]|nr:type II toxin-antitoxin system PemK/MazF family toxin [Campylobacterota bacterium]